MTIAELRVRISADPSSAVSGLEQTKSVMQATQKQTAELAKAVALAGLNLSGLGYAGRNSVSDLQSLGGASRALAIAQKELALDRAENQWQRYLQAIGAANVQLSRASEMSGRDRAAIELYGTTYGNLTQSAQRWAAAQLGAKYSAIDHAKSMQILANAQGEASAKLSLLSDRSLQNVTAVRLLGKAYAELAADQQGAIQKIAEADAKRLVYDSARTAMRALYFGGGKTSKGDFQTSKSSTTAFEDEQDPGQAFAHRKKLELERISATTTEERAAIESYGIAFSELSDEQQDYVTNVLTPLLEKLDRVSEAHRNQRDVTRALREEQGRLLGNITELTGGYNQVESTLRRLGVDGAAALSRHQVQLIQNVARLREMQDVYSRLGDGVRSTFNNIFSDLYRNGFGGFFNNVLGGFRNLLQQMSIQWATTNLTRLTMQGIAGLVGGFGVGGGGKSSLGNSGSLMNFQPAYAEGGIAMAGIPALVGEKGPEIFVPSVTGRVVSNDVAFPALGRVEGSKTITVHNHFSIQSEHPKQFEENIGYLAARVGMSIQRSLRRNG